MSSDVVTAANTQEGAAYERWASAAPMRVLVAQIGARRHYAVPRALHRTRLLERLVTDACGEIHPWRTLDWLTPAPLRPALLQSLLGRTTSGVPASRIRGCPWFALSGLWDRRRGESDTGRWARRNATFGRLVLKAGFGEADTVYAYNGAALEVFQAARQEGLRTILDQTAAPWRWNTELLREEAERWPGWEAQPAEADTSGRLAEREEAEWALADRIVCGSKFAARAVGECGGPVERCAVVAYPAPAGFSPGADASERLRRQGPLRVLFVGTLQLRKGVPYLLEAAKLLPSEDVIFRLIGPSQISEQALRALRAETEVLGPIPRSEIAGHYAWADVFVLPTLSEGSANVCREAMAAGVPVVTTPHAGAPIRDGENGLLVPIRDAEALVRAIVRLGQNAALRQRLARTALETSRQFDFDTYAARLVSALPTSDPSPGAR